MKLLFILGSRGEWGYIKPIIDICKKKKLNIPYVQQTWFYCQVMAC